jgi:hypothetical protein
MRTTTKITAAFVLFGCHSLADNPDFALTITKGQQDSDYSYNRVGIPIVICPHSGLHKPNDFTMDQSSKDCFFVFIRNTGRDAHKITMSSSAWHECLQFRMEDASGKVYVIRHKSVNWSANPMKHGVSP